MADAKSQIGEKLKSVLKGKNKKLQKEIRVTSVKDVNGKSLYNLHFHKWTSDWKTDITEDFVAKSDSEVCSAIKSFFKEEDKGE